MSPKLMEPRVLLSQDSGGVTSSLPGEFIP